MTPDRKPYHHGDLARAALEAAVAIVRGDGADALSMREVAARVGVAHRALYRHFGDRDGLLAAVAAAGYDDLAARAAGAATAPAFVRAFARFAVDEPRLYALMTSQSGRQIAAVPALHQATAALIALSLRALGDGSGGMRERDRVIAVWALIHGTVSLCRSGIVRAAGPDEIVDYVMALLAQSGLLPG